MQSCNTGSRIDPDIVLLGRGEGVIPKKCEHMAVAPHGLMLRHFLLAPIIQQDLLGRDVHFHMFGGHLHQHTNSEQNIDQLISISSF